MYATGVFAALLALGLVACKGRLGGLKAARGVRGFSLQCLSPRNLYKKGYSFPSLALSTFCSARLQPVKNQKGKIWVGANFAFLSNQYRQIN